MRNAQPLSATHALRVMAMLQAMKNEIFFTRSTPTPMHELDASSQQPPGVQDAVAELSQSCPRGAEPTGTEAATGPMT